MVFYATLIRSLALSVLVLRLKQYMMSSLAYLYSPLHSDFDEYDNNDLSGDFLRLEESEWLLKEYLSRVDLIK